MNPVNQLSTLINGQLNPLRKLKRDLAYDAHDAWRALTQRSELSKIINQKEIRFIGLRRSGNHAVLHWIKAQIPNVKFLNNVSVETSPFRHYHLHFPHKGFHDEAWGKFQPKDCFIYSYEDYSVAEIVHSSTEKKHDLYIGKTQNRYNVLVLRDPFNLLASRLRKNYLDVKTEGILLIDMWIEHAKEYVGETSYLGNQKVVINYNYWFSDKDYRQGVAEALDINFSDAGLDYVSSYGGGSSFDQQGLSGNAQTMDVTNRWQTFAEDERFLLLIKNEELLHYSNQIFGIMPGTEAIQNAS
ncbi:hypothetical protein D0962_08205 [Leptolyngbyaceae cyanobacterium CCMR0082]|uniref:Sulfotransferase n=1 Tax=Adonisia turfae CCMR0082 TaxID=2304604 RepID=A0A6M0S4F9_9CYAN|nr:hypothetical protein [Adonisia turfae]NEZ62762.1 hypothetical protein [Adonisia turfae CCMR0082]